MNGITSNTASQISTLNGLSVAAIESGDTDAGSRCRNNLMDFARPVIDDVNLTVR